MNQGINVMLHNLFGDPTSHEVFARAQGKTIVACLLDEDANALRLRFADGTGIYFVDDGQSCCESRYMRTDDDCARLIGAQFQNVIIKNVIIKEAPASGDHHEVQFVEIRTTTDAIVFSNHNEHNGYYGGIELVLRDEERPL